MATFNLNDSATWACADVYSQPDFDLESYQARVDEICGKAANGQSNVIVLWAASPQAFRREFCEWDEGGNGTKTHLRAKYCHWTYDNGKILVDVPVPRWAIEQRLDGAQYAATDDLTRWKTTYVGDSLNPENKQKVLQEIRPKRPTDGYYTALIGSNTFIGYHDRKCCKKAKAEQNVCYGKYREPDDSYLEMLKRAVKARALESDQRADEPLTAKTLKKAALEAANYIQRNRELAKQATDDYVDENFKEMLEGLTGIKVDTKQFSFPTTKTQSGLYIPNLN